MCGTTSSRCSVSRARNTPVAATSASVLQGERLKAALIRVYTAYLCSAQALYEKHGKGVDPWMTPGRLFQLDAGTRRHAASGG